MEDQRAEEAYFRAHPETMRQSCCPEKLKPQASIPVEMVAIMKNMNNTLVQACSDSVHHPQHYTQGGIEPIDYIRANHLNFCLGNVVKYVTRAGKKKGSSRLEDLQKAMEYIKFEIEAEKVGERIGKHEIH